MLHPEVLRRNDCIAALAMLYAAYGFYPDDPILQEYEVVKTSSAPISRSGFGLCWKGLFLGKHKVAVKGLRSHQNEERTTKLLERETEIWRRLNHTHVLRFIGLCALDDEMYVVSPWMDNGDAPSYIQRNPHADCVELLLQVALGLEYLHTFSPTVVHGDLRGANILISSLGHAQISDFGLSHMVDDKDGHSYSAAWFNAGSPRWLAPELLAKDNSSEAVWRTTASDVFSFGRLILELTSGRIPFFETVDDGLVRLKVGEGEIPERPQDEDALARGLDEDMWGLAVECWHREPSMRPIAQDLVHHLEALLQARGGSLPLEI
ncbi:hypothetical protein BOTBODRAFT_109220 [Botryobasidium botryosum FD-172 SS1]|uniref:Protein kinase domain-containing protein n=1 Tax=Botryobasidium botryosum (strain FD-172 SS1) TaxID=930990 RepID=A0A067MHN6_BOTB1|nr:hypothetical protein BOTBODRAFT_109220 [Botryobasidium botryosum FD-172 SS1]